jgi:hypothetical protein
MGGLGPVLDIEFAVLLHAATNACGVSTLAGAVFGDLIGATILVCGEFAVAAVVIAKGAVQVPGNDPKAPTLALIEIVTPCSAGVGIHVGEPGVDRQQAQKTVHVEHPGQLLLQILDRGNGEHMHQPHESAVVRVFLKKEGERRRKG